MLNLHVRNERRSSKADSQESRVVETAESTGTKANAGRKVSRLRTTPAATISADYQAEYVALDHSLPMCRIPLTNGDGKTVVAFAVTYRQWEPFLTVCDWRLENGIPVTTLGSETVSMIGLMKHPMLAESIPCDRN